LAQETLRVLEPDGTVRGEEPDLGEEDLLRIYRHMLLCRLLDERMMALQRQGRIGFYGTVTGEEAAVIGSAYALRREDWIFPALRQGGAAILRGYPLVRYVAQLMGNREDVLKGHMQPCHYSSRDVNFVSWSSCIANQLPQAVGAAMAARYRGDDVVVMAYLGDGATSASDFHVAMNFAGVFRPPVVFVCQNNHWAISVPVSRQTASPTLAIKAVAYGLPGVRVDGNDVLAVYGACREAVDRARTGDGATFIEAVTYRLGAHSTADDPSRYRSEEEVEAWRAKDPIRRFRSYLERRGLLDDSGDASMKEEIEEEISKAIKLAEAAGPPSWETLLEDVFEGEPWNLREQRETLSGLLRKTP
jgi:pyruvate dehydrogenase E1 component alpha subunit/2-oxoisovalerate dehydrogenase E1 component alpha subunit